MKLLLLTAFFIIIGEYSAVKAQIEAHAIYVAWKPAMAAPGHVGAQSGEIFQNLRLRLYLTNRGTEDVRVPTKELGIATVVSHRAMKIEFLASQHDNALGLREIMPESMLGIVTLRQNETAAVIFDAAIDENTIDTIDVAYNVPKGFAMRYGLWSGEITVRACSESAVKKKVNPTSQQ